MDLWLFALIALALVPVVRLFMAAGCRPAPPPPGDRPLMITVTKSDEIPGGGRADVTILNGSVHVYSPSGNPPIDLAFETDGVNEERVVAPLAFEGASSPYEWTAEARVDYEVTSPLTLRGGGTVRGGAAFEWDANRNGWLVFTLRLEDEGDTGLTGPSGVRRLVWRLPSTFGASGTT